MDSSTSFSQKLSIQKEKISNSKTNAVIRTRFDKAVDEINKGGLLDGKTFLIKDNIAIKSEPLSCASKILKSYISQFNASTGKNHDPANCTIELDDMWLNIQREGDFNPVHNHNCRSVSGISTFCWLTFPKQVMKTSREGNKGSSHKRMTYLHWSSTPSWANRQFMFPGNVGLLPTPGVIVMFPSWLEHVVYPFNGSGKRQSLASNINVKF